MKYVKNLYYGLYYVRPKHGTNRIRGDFVGYWELCGMYMLGGDRERESSQLVFVPYIYSC
jgi:hypothetical protein